MSEASKYISSLRSPKIPGFSWQDPEDEADRKIFRDVLGHGCHIVAVGDEPGLPPFAYSIGFYLNHLQPEIFAMGLSFQLSGQVINKLFGEVENGRKLEENQTLDGFFADGRSGLLKAFSKDLYYDFLGYACWFYRSLMFQPPAIEPKFPVLQLLWPDKDGKFPFEEGCHPTVVAAQRVMKPKPRSGEA